MKHAKKSIKQLLGSLPKGRSMDQIESAFTRNGTAKRFYIVWLDQAPVTWGLASASVKVKRAVMRLHLPDDEYSRTRVSIITPRSEMSLREIKRALAQMKRDPHTTIQKFPQGDLAQLYNFGKLFQFREVLGGKGRKKYGPLYADADQIPTVYITTGQMFVENEDSETLLVRCLYVGKGEHNGANEVARHFCKYTHRKPGEVVFEVNPCIAYVTFRSDVPPGYVAIFEAAVIQWAYKTYGVMPLFEVGEHCIIMNQNLFDGTTVYRRIVAPVSPTSVPALIQAQGEHKRFVRENPTLEDFDPEYILEHGRPPSNINLAGSRASVFVGKGQKRKNKGTGLQTKPVSGSNPGSIAPWDGPPQPEQPCVITNPSRMNDEDIPF